MILHDIGKIYELSYERGFSYSDEGQLLGHMLIAVPAWWAISCGTCPIFRRGLRSLVEHLIISHHGTLESGSPKTPVFPEAMMLHYLDDMDSKMECMRRLIETDRQLAGNFTSYSPSLDRELLLKKDRYPGRAGTGGRGPQRLRQRRLRRINRRTAQPPRNSSPFGDKLLMALQPAKREGWMRRASTREIPPPLELLCLNALWSLGEGSVKDVRESVAPSRSLAYTTVMTVLDRLARRGVVSRRKARLAFVYAPAVSRDAMRRLALQEFLDVYFESSAHQLIEFLHEEPRRQMPVLAATGLDPSLL